ncbi:TraX family protein [Niallia sp. MER 6]|uniref:TraX family protein n=1 Tax=Niallia sp. MER 6 TaxID=2939567 RepID=UPI00203F1C23|nr:TraX family protein [Niallia sp. MER 6]MCM3033350.1 conjugal transfer protein TraX [Niallia sp. MER 6]
MQSENLKLVNSNVLKLIAILSMVVDHIAVGFVPSGTTLELILRTIGRLAAPIIFYLIAEGYFYTSNVKKYLKRLFIFAVISHFPFVMYFGISWFQGTSVIWTLFLGLVALTIVQKPSISVFDKVMFVALCCLLAWMADWNYIGVLWIMFFGVFRGRFQLQILNFVLIGIFLYAIPGIYTSGLNSVFRLGFLLVIPLLALYNGKQGRKSKVFKWGFYFFYPLHLLLLYILKYYISI